MRALLTGRIFNMGMRLIIGVVFVYAALDKIVYPQQFAIAVRGYQMIPLSISNMFAIAVPWSEMIAGGMLILGILTRRAAAATLILLAMFVGAMATVLIRGMVVDCGCFGSEGGSSTVGPFLIVRNLFLMAGAFLVMRYNDGFMSLRPGRSATS